MSIKVEMFIQLPYVINLKEGKNYKFKFNFDEFQEFLLEFRFNDESENDIYDENYQNDQSKNIRVEAVYSDCNYLNYEREKSLYNSENNENAFIINLPLEETNKIFKNINNRVNQILSFLCKKSNMFWIEAISIKSISTHYDNAVKFNFYSPNTILRSSFKKLRAYSKDYMVSGDIEVINRVNDDLFKTFDIKDSVLDTYNIYLNKAKKSMYEENYEEFLIYCAISTESFIKEYITKLEPKNDIIYNKLSRLNSNYLDKYYNLLLKHVKGYSLQEMDEACFTILKRMYKLRSSVMHNGKIDSNSLEKVGLSHLESLNFEESKKILDSIELAYRMIGKLN